MLKFASIFAAASALFSCEVMGYGDHGHMLVAMIAKKNMTAKSVAKIEGLLKHWEPDYPGGHTLQVAATWLDHTACNLDIACCRGYSTVDDIKLFKDWHFQSNILNPQGIKLQGIDAFKPLPNTGIVWALGLIWHSLLATTSGTTDIQTCKRGNEPWCTDGTTRTRILTTPEPKGLDALRDTIPTQAAKIGSAFSLNYHIRLLLHLMGDLHQPLHNADTFSTTFPGGDYGGNEVTVSVTDEGHAEPFKITLHHVWDSIGLSAHGSFYNITDAELEEGAAELMAQFPRESMKDRLDGPWIDGDFNDISLEAKNVAETVAYSEIDWSTFSLESLPYKPTMGYLALTEKTCHEWITLGGYRLAILLEKLVTLLPTASNLKESYIQEL